MMITLQYPPRGRLIKTLINLSLLALLPAVAARAQERDPLSDMGGFGVELHPRNEAIEKLLPVYPEEAIAKGVQGVVMVRIGIDREGRVGRVKVPPRTHPLLRRAAVVAARGWRFEPMPQHVYSRPGTYFTYRLTFQFVIEDGEARAGLHPDWRYGPCDGCFAVVAREWATWEDATDDYKDDSKDKDGTSDAGGRATSRRDRPKF